MQRSSQVATQEGALVDFVIHIDDGDITILQAVQYPLVGGAAAAKALSLCVSYGKQVGTAGCVHRGDGTTDHLVGNGAVQIELRMKCFQITLKLAFVTLNKDGLPQFFQGHFGQSIQIGVGNTGTSVFKSLAFPQGGHGDQLFSAGKNHSFPPMRNAHNLFL